jgi:hypothetical protein
MKLTAELFLTILGTAVVVGGSIATFAVWAFKAVIAKDVTPTLVKLGSEANALTNEFVTLREGKAEERAEVRAILKDLDLLVRNHDSRIAVHDARIAVIESRLTS